MTSSASFGAGLLALLVASCAADPYGGLDDEFGFAPNPPPPPGGGVGGSSSSCHFMPADSNLHFDLTPMTQKEHDFTSATAGGYTYRFNVCGDTVKVCNSQPAPAAKWRGTKCNNLGDKESLQVSLLDADAPSKGVKLSYTQGDICKKQTPDGGTEMGSRFVTYEMSCSWYDEGTLKSIREVSMCEYVVLFDSKYACPVSSNGMFKSVMTLLVLSFFLYCVLGAAYNYHYHQMKGLDAVPNKAMWDEVPGLVREGVQFSYTKGMEYGGKGYAFAKEKYENYKASRATGA